MSCNSVYVDLIGKLVTERGSFTPFDRPCLRLQWNILFIVVLLLFCVSCFGRWCRVSSLHHPSSFLRAQIAQRTCTWRVSGVTRACRTWQCVWRPSVVTSLRMPPFLSFDRRLLSLKWKQYNNRCHIPSSLGWPIGCFSRICTSSITYTQCRISSHLHFFRSFIEFKGRQKKCTRFKLIVVTSQV